MVEFQQIVSRKGDLLKPLMETGFKQGLCQIEALDFALYL